MSPLVLLRTGVLLVLEVSDKSFKWPQRREERRVGTNKGRKETVRGEVSVTQSTEWLCRTRRRGDPETYTGRETCLVEKGCVVGTVN